MSVKLSQQHIRVRVKSNACYQVFDSTAPVVQ